VLSWISVSLPKDISRVYRLPLVSYKFEEVEFLSPAPLSENDSVCSMISCDPIQPRDIIGRWAPCGPAFSLDKYDVEEVSAFQSGSIMAMVLSDGEEIYNAARLRLCFAAKVYQVPPYACSTTECDKPLCHGARPFRRMLRFAARGHVE
jgi:hypothetical protein